jgi:hypothetical protein
VLLQSKYLKARASEFENIEVSAEQARRAGHIDDKPLLVLTAGRAVDASLKAVLTEKDQRAYEETGSTTYNFVWHTYQRGAGAWWCRTAATTCQQIVRRSLCPP